MALLLRAQLFTKLFSMIWIVLFQILQSITNPEQPFLILKRLLRIQVLTDLGKGAEKYIQSPKQAKVDVFPASRYHWTFCFWLTQALHKMQVPLKNRAKGNSIG